jgi:threonine dehydrogenase-like Zn-dependent dehydrogenase
MMIDADVLEAAVAIGCLVGALAPLAGIAGVIAVDVRRDRRRARR